MSTRCSYLQCLLIVFDVVAINVVMGTDWLPQFGTNYHTRSLGCGTTTEEHDSSASVDILRLQETDCHAQSNTGTSQGTLIVCDGPRVSLQLLQCVGQLKFTFRNGKQKSRAHASWRSPRLLLYVCSGNVTQAKHFLDLFRRVVLAAAENVRLSASCISQLVDLSL